jgi:superfamily I DNA and/or RNA helicase
VVVENGGTERPLGPRDVAVITPHVEQASAVAARLADLPEVLIGTANQAQGLEREAVVVIHPLAGYRDAPAFATDSGRLCVALSRHRAHATLIVDSNTETVLRHAQAEAPGDTALAIQRHVLTALCSTT